MSGSGRSLPANSGVTRGGKDKDRNAPLSYAKLGGLEGMGKGRAELERLMGLYRVRPMPGQANLPQQLLLAESEQKQIEELEAKQKSITHTVNAFRIETIANKPPELRQAHEVEQLRQEIEKMKVFDKFFLTDSQEGDLCKAVKIVSVEPRCTLIAKGQIGDKFYAVLEGYLTESRGDDSGKERGLYPGDVFGEGCLKGETLDAQEPYPISVSVNKAKLLVFRRAEYDRYIRPSQVEKAARIRSFLPTVPEFADFNEQRLAKLHAAVMHKRYFMGELICEEGRFLNHLMFIMSGHCAATKRVAPQVRLRRTELLPSPLRGASAAGGAHGAADAPVAEEVELEVATLYLGAGVDPDAAITRSPCSHSVRALSVVECITFDASVHLGEGSPLLDQETLNAIRRRCHLVLTEDALQARCKDVTSWNTYKEHMRSHLIFRKRRELLATCGSFTSQREPRRDDLVENVDLDHFPVWAGLGKQDARRRTLTDGRWPSAPNP